MDGKGLRCGSYEVKSTGAAATPKTARKGEKRMLNKLLEEQDALYDRLDNLEGCEENPVYAAEIQQIRKRLAEIKDFLDTELF